MKVDKEEQQCSKEYKCHLLDQADGKFDRQTAGQTDGQIRSAFYV